MLVKLIMAGVSLIAILLVSLLSSKLGLGGDNRLRSEDQARELAAATVCGFDPVDIALDRAGIGALLRDEAGQVMLLRRHGAHFVGRLLDQNAFARLDRHLLTIGPGERLFGGITLDLGDQAQVWAASLRRLGAAAPDVVRAGS